MTTPAATIEGRMMCASSAAYSIQPNGSYTALEPYHGGVGWLGAPVAIIGGTQNINACLVGVNQDGIIVAFRGTVLPVPITKMSILDWWQDIVDSEPKPIPGVPGKVHCGFKDAVQTIWAQLLTQVGIFKGLHPGMPVYMTGHSKGGPMATISAARTHFDTTVGWKPIAVYTYASPHPGDKDFVKDFPLTEIPVTRYENYLDVVPLVPPSEKFIQLASKSKLLGDLFKLAEGWNYASLGERKYINRKHEVISGQPQLTPKQFAKLAFMVAAGPCGLRKVALAHMYTCGYGYMKGLCPTGVCP
nr:putative lipase [uncultured bacterium]